MSDITTTFVRLRSSRAPYTRGGISFRSTREPLEVERSTLTSSQIAKLEADPVVRVEYFERETGPLGAGGETHIVQAVGEPSLAPQASGVALGSPAAAAGVSTSDSRPLDLQSGAVVEQMSEGGVSSLPPGGAPDSLVGGQGGETVFAGSSSDTLTRDFSGDTLMGGQGAETVFGGQGAETIFGGQGGDTLEGGSGGSGDTVVGGQGASGRKKAAG